MGNNCKGCTERCVGCHITCETYLAWKQEQNARRADINKVKQDAQRWKDYKERSIRLARLDYDRRRREKSKGDNHNGRA